MSPPSPRRCLAVALGAGLLLTGAGCGSVSPSAATVRFATNPTTTGSAVRYGDAVRVDRSEFERELEALVNNKGLQSQSGGNGLAGAGKKTVDPRLTAGWLTAVIYDKLITHEFDKRHLTVTADDTEAGKQQLATQFGTAAVAGAFPDWFQKRITGRNARAVAVRDALTGVDLSDAGMRRYFDEHKADFAQNCLSHILVRTKEQADAVLARLKAGEDFATVAKATSIDTGSGSKGGDLGCNPKGTFVAEFDEAANSLPVGQLSDVVQTQYGYHIILVRERKEASFEDSKEQVRAALTAQTQGAFRQFLLQAVTTAQVTLDPRYGTFAPPASNQPPEVVPPVPPKPNTERTDNTPATEPLPGEPAGSPGSPVQKIGG